jgi:hypothetical protein
MDVERVFTKQRCSHQRLIRGPEDRLGKGGIEDLKKHAFFKGFDWNNLRDMNPPFIPNVRSPHFFFPPHYVLPKLTGIYGIMITPKKQLEDELDTTYFSGLAEEAAEEGGEDPNVSIDVLLNKELAKGSQDRDETSLSNIFSHKDLKKGKIIEKEHEELAQAKEAEGTENLKLKFNSSYTKFEFAAFTYKHEDLAEVGLGVPDKLNLKDISRTSTPRSSPRSVDSAPSSPRDHFGDDAGGKRPKSPKTSSPSIVRSPSDPDTHRTKVSRTPSAAATLEGHHHMITTTTTTSSTSSGIPHAESSPTIAVSVGKKHHRRNPSSPNALPPTSPRFEHNSSHPLSPSSSSSSMAAGASAGAGAGASSGSNAEVSIGEHSPSSGGALSKIKKRLSALRSKFKRDDDSAPNSPAGSPERKGSSPILSPEVPRTRGRSGTIDESESPHVGKDSELLEVKSRAHKRISEGRRNRGASAPQPLLPDKAMSDKERILAKARAFAAASSAGSAPSSGGATADSATASSSSANLTSSSGSNSSSNHSSSSKKKSPRAAVPPLPLPQLTDSPGVPRRDSQPHSKSEPPSRQNSRKKITKPPKTSPTGDKPAGLSMAELVGLGLASLAYVSSLHLVAAHNIEYEPSSVARAKTIVFPNE